MWQLIADLAAVWGPWRFLTSEIDFVRARKDLHFLRSYLPRTKSIPAAENRHDPHTAAKSEISGHTDSIYTILLKSRKKECAFTELPIYMYIHIHIYIHIWIYIFICKYTQVSSADVIEMTRQSMAYVHKCVYIYMHLYIHVYINTGGVSRCD